MFFNVLLDENIEPLHDILSFKNFAYTSEFNGWAANVKVYTERNFSTRHSSGDWGVYIDANYSPSTGPLIVVFDI